jgi:leucyl aminopeptidase
MKITFGELALPKSGTVVAGVLEDGELTRSAEALDNATDGSVRRAIAASRFSGKKDELLDIVAPANLPLSRILLAGLGKASSIDAAQMQGLGGAILAHLNGARETEAAVQLDAIEGAIEPGDAAANFAYGARLRSYRFDRYRTNEKPEKKPTLAKLAVLSADSAAAKRAYGRLDKVADAVFFTRDLVSEPANILYPETLAERAKSLTDLGVTVEVLDEKKMAKLGMGALLGVGQGSARPPRLVVMQYKGNPKSKEAPLAFCGKGVTFDTGGISIKPAAGMEDMKWDMGGAGVVIGLMKALAGRKAKVNAVGLVGLVENMPGANAQRPGDIVSSMSGQTIEVLNTDAEGRLVLADVMWYCQDRFKPRFMIDLATLTGAIIVALGNDYAGLFANDEQLSQQLVAAGRTVNEKLWPMPLGESYDRQLDSDAADVKNIGGGREAGSITAAQFIQRFVNNTPWAHLDIAGVTWSKKDSAIAPKGATAFGVRLLDRFVADNYET